MKQFLKTFPVVAVLLSACRVSLVPDYNATIYQKIVSTAARNDRLYIDLMQADAGQRSFALYAKRYAALETAIESLFLHGCDFVLSDCFFMVIRVNIKMADKM